MIHRLTLATTVVLLSLTLTLAADPPRGPKGGHEAPALAADPTGTPASLRVLRATYDVDVLGPLAVGELARELISEVDVDLTAATIAPSPGLAVERTEVEVAGQVHDLRSPAPAARGSRANSASRAKPPAARSAARSARREPIQVEAGQPVVVREQFRMALPMRDGRFLLRLPAVTAQDSAGTNSASRDEPRGPITIVIHHDEPLPYAESPTHDVIASYEGDRTVVELAELETESRSFEFEFALGVEDDATLVGQAVTTEDGTHDVVVVLTPPMEPGEGTVRPKQVVFVIDSSGSMGKDEKLNQAREALGTCLGMLRSDDQFNIVAFKNTASIMSEEPVSGEESALQRASAWLGGLRAGGGTHLLPALGAAIEQPVSEERHRMVVLLTDGAVQDRREAELLLESDLGEARLFVIGIGEDVARASITSLAEFGRGTAVFADDAEGLDAVMAAMFTSVSEPLAWDLALDWGGAEIESMEPARLPDLYAGRPVTIRARVRGELPEQVSLEATTTTGLRRLATTLTPADEGRRSRIGKR